MRCESAKRTVCILLLVFWVAVLPSVVFAAEEKSAAPDAAAVAGGQNLPPATSTTNVPASAENPKSDRLPFNITQEAKLLNHDVYPGDRITMQVKFSAEKTFIAEIFGDLPLGKFELDDKRIERSEEGGRYSVTFFIDLLTFETGLQSLPKIPFRLRDSAGNEEMRDSGELRIDVKSVLMEEVQKQAMRMAKEQAAGKQSQNPQGGSRVVTPGANDPIGPTFNVPAPADPNASPNQPGVQAPAPGQPQQPGAAPEQQVKVEPRDIKGVVDLIEKDYTLLYVFGAFVAAGMLALILWLLLRRKPQEEEPVAAEPVDTRPAHVIALERLQELERRGLIAKRQLKDFHLELSDILRDYFERRFSFNASSMSTEEVMDVLRNLYMKGLDERLVEMMLLRCDLVKFAKLTPDDESSIRLLKDSYTVIERTREEEATNGVR